MWLLNVDSRQLEEFIGDEVPDYAILSHTWGADEVSFKEILKGVPSAKAKAGYRKIELTCNQAKEDGARYVWIDTCCIDKCSSAELSEAINSMYRWYEQARCCYAFLSDLTTKSGFDLQECRWFKRGWTLQELLAPSTVRFYNENWEYVGNKIGLHKYITAATRISLEVLDKSRRLSSLSVAKRMSWMARRETTRVEDKAYCLLGIFDVNMTLLYGERTASFLRLQEEILKKSDDHSIFAWSIPGTVFEERYGMFAPSPSAFAKSGGIESFRDWGNLSMATTTSSGLSIQLTLHQSKGHNVYAKLNCRSEECSEAVTEGASHTRCQIFVPLLRVPGTSSHYNRVGVAAIWTDLPHYANNLPGEFRQIHIQQAIIAPSPKDVNSASFWMLERVKGSRSCTCIGLVHVDKTRLDYVQFTEVSELSGVIFRTSRGEELHCALLFKIPRAHRKDAKIAALKMGHKAFFEPCGFAVLFGSGRSYGTIGYRFMWLDASLVGHQVMQSDGYPFSRRSVAPDYRLHVHRFVRFYKPENIVGYTHFSQCGLPKGMNLSFGVSVENDMHQLQLITIEVDYQKPSNLLV